MIYPVISPQNIHLYHISPYVTVHIGDGKLCLSNNLYSKLLKIEMLESSAQTFVNLLHEGVCDKALINYLVALNNSEVLTYKLLDALIFCGVIE